MTVLAFPTVRRLPVQDVDRPCAQPKSYEEMMVLRHCLGRPWLDMLAHDDQARIAGSQQERA